MLHFLTNEQLLVQTNMSASSFFLYLGGVNVLSNSKLVCVK